MKYSPKTQEQLKYYWLEDFTFSSEEVALSCIEQVKRDDKKENLLIKTQLWL